MARVLFILGALLTLSGGLSWTVALGPTRHAGLLSSVAEICLQSGVACVVVGLLVHARQRFFTSITGSRRAVGKPGARDPEPHAVASPEASDPRVRCHACGYDCSRLVRGIYACPECGVVLAQIPSSVRGVADAAGGDANGASKGREGTHAKGVGRGRTP